MRGFLRAGSETPTACGIHFQDITTAKVFHAILNNIYMKKSHFEDKKEQDILDVFFKRGWVNAGVGSSQEVVYRFTTRLHRWVVGSYLGFGAEKLNIRKCSLNNSRSP